MFNWFSRPSYKIPEQFNLPDLKFAPPMPGVTAPTYNQAYSVGISTDGTKTIFKIEHVTLTMTREGAEQLIRMLEASLPVCER